MAQAVEHLPSKCEALSSKPSTSEKNKIPLWWWYIPIVSAIQEADCLRLEVLDWATQSDPCLKKRKPGASGSNL
jgi:hypothetical protein